MDREARIAGVLIGTALGDALGLPCEGMSAARIARRFGRIDRFRLLGPTGFVSDDTEQSALVAQSLARRPDDPARAFRRSLLGWFLRLPWGVGLATVRASARIALGFRTSGVPSAGNGALMRAAVVGAVLEDPVRRRDLGGAIARATHTDPRAVEAALYSAELVAAGPDTARKIVADADLGAALDRAAELADRGATTEEAARILGTSGYAVHSLGLASFCFRRFGDRPLEALQECISAGGDTDSIAAVLGSWLGARHGEAGLPADLVARIHDGPFGPSHLRALARALASGSPPPRYSCAGAMLRNLALIPVILAHGLRRLIP